MIATKNRAPSLVVVAVAMFALSWILSFMRVLLTSGWFNNPASVLAMCLYCVIVYLICRALYRGVNWVRWLALILAVIAIFGSLRSFVLIPSVWERSAFVAGGVLQMVGAVLLFLPSARFWYGPNNSFKPKPLRGSA